MHAQTCSVIFQQEFQIFTNSSFANVRMCCFSFVIYDIKLNIYGFWTESWVKHVVLKCHRGQLSLIDDIL